MQSFSLLVVHALALAAAVRLAPAPHGLPALLRRPAAAQRAPAARCFVESLLKLKLPELRLPDGLPKLPKLPNGLPKLPDELRLPAMPAMPGGATVTELPSIDWSFVDACFLITCPQPDGSNPRLDRARRDIAAVGLADRVEVRSSRLKQNGRICSPPARLQPLAPSHAAPAPRTGPRVWDG